MSTQASSQDVKIVLLAGGLGTRLSEETEIKPKPMVEIGGRPILWHIMKHYAHFGFKEFFLALGYKGDVIKRYFLDYYTLNGSMTVDLTTGRVEARERQERGPRHGACDVLAERLASQVRLSRSGWTEELNLC